MMKVEAMRLFKVKEVADLVGVSVRTLHHYDQIGLLKPGSASPAGYRLYTDQDLEKLQQVLFFKELGFSLQETKVIIDNPGFDRKQAMIGQKKLLIAKKNRLERIITSLEQTITSLEGGMRMNGKEMFKAFDMTDIEEHKAKYAAETKEKYGNTTAYHESMAKTSKYTKEDWARITANAGEIHQKVFTNMPKGAADPEVQKAIAELRQHITDNFYNCTPEIFRGLGDLYVNDERFTANIDKTKPGLAKFLREAMHFYCDNLVQ